MPNRMFGDPKSLDLEDSVNRMVAVVSMPTLGRIVYYYSQGSADTGHRLEVHPAMVTDVDGTVASLAVIHPTGMFFDADVPYSPTPSPGCWSWPPQS